MIVIIQHGSQDYRIEVNDVYSTIGQLKESIKTKKGIVVARQILECEDDNGVLTEMPNEHALHRYGIEDGDRIYLREKASVETFEVVLVGPDGRRRPIRLSFADDSVAALLTQASGYYSNFSSIRLNFRGTELIRGRTLTDSGITNGSDVSITGNIPGGGVSFPRAL
eukprot:scpid92829/ scgid33974/ 